MDTASFAEFKRQGRGVIHPSPSSAEVKDRVQLYLFSQSGLRGLFYGEISLYLSCGEPQQAVLYLLTAAACFGICDGIQVLNTRYLKLKVN